MADPGGRFPERDKGAIRSFTDSLIHSFVYFPGKLFYLIFYIFWSGGGGGGVVAMVDPIQNRLMEELVILVDDQDRPIGTESKRISHSVEHIRKGMLHRAFSVFLFDAGGKLLLQQRAAEKITFPNYWTNTCCSHPIVSIDPTTYEPPTAAESSSSSSSSSSPPDEEDMSGHDGAFG